MLGWSWWSSLVPSTYSVMEMGHTDLGGGSAAGHDHGTGHSGGQSVAALTGPQSGDPDVAVELTAARGTFELAGGDRIEGYTLNGSSPGPALEVHQGDLVQVTLINADVPDGVTLHWHGVDVPNAEDGVAGVTQDAVAPGESHVYRFVAEDAGTYWYHSHQVSHRQVRGGLFGTLVVLPAGGRDEQDVVAAVHTYQGHRTVNGRTGITTVETEPGRPVRVRLVNTDNGPLRAWVSGAAFRVVAVDGTDVHEPTAVRSEGVLVTAGGRLDLLLEEPARVSIRGGAALVLGPRGTDVPEEPEPPDVLDLLDYGTAVELGFDPDRADRDFRYEIGRRIGFLDGRPGFWWTVNGRLFPDVPMFHVAEGDVVRMTITNDSGDVHPMHLHGHHAVVLSRDGVPPPAVRGGSTRSTSPTGRATRSPSSRTTPASGWTTATTSTTPATGWWRTWLTPGSPNRSRSAASTTTRRSDPAPGQRLCRASSATAMEAATRKSRRGSGTCTS
ncbi:multicopper oxidase family protein [Blastococcus sp. PRF04-17]|nr:multicopper oxidase family protein [Blastococcus sp. PRF04-17]UOY03863.1 multicopper oxidase family protein [Blastococcus sp. PRF04-17]